MTLRSEVLGFWGLRWETDDYYSYSYHWLSEPPLPDDLGRAAKRKGVRARFNTVFDVGFRYIRCEGLGSLPSKVVGSVTALVAHLLRSLQAGFFWA